MKSAPFDYIRAASIAQVCTLLAADPDVRPLAGGQTLIPMLAMRLARPRTLVDLAGIAELAGVRATDAHMEIGAMVRQATAERLESVARHLPLLAVAIPWVGHAPTRARGTIGGSIANADPAAEIPLIAVTLGAEVLVATPHGSQIIAANEFFIAAMVTSLPTGGMVTAVRFPIGQGARRGVGFAEVNARSSDFAIAAAAAQIELDGAGRVHRALLGIGGIGDVPVRVDLSALVGEWPDASQISRIASAAIDGMDAHDDLQASAAYRRRAAAALARQAVADALRPLAGARS